MEDIVPLPTVQLYLKSTEGKGRGVFCHESIAKRTLIHVSPVLILAGQDNDLVQRTILNHYTYNWGKDQAVALGLGSMFNHSRINNVGFVSVKEKEIIEYYALRDIPAETELCIHYGPHLWFDDADGPEEVATEGDTDSTESDFLKVLDLWE
jgi:SET domain-containing protein